MPSNPTTQVLNRVLVVHNRSLPMYLTDAAPVLRPGEERVTETLEQIVRDQRQVVDRIGSMLDEEGAPWDLGEFPMPFTGYHDVSFDFLLPLLIDRQRRMITYLQKCAEDLRLAPLAKAVVEETVGLARGHLELLEELKHPPKPRPAVVAAAHDHEPDHGSAHTGHH